LIAARALLAVALLASAAHADTPWLDEQPKLATDDVPRPIVGFRATGDTKLRDHTLRYLSRYGIGDRVSVREIPIIVEALQTSQLFESIVVTLELTEDGAGVIVVATLDDKHSWIAIPALFLFTGAKAFGIGYAENNLFGENMKLLLYGQIANSTTYFFGTLLTPRVRGTNWSTRFDIYPSRRITREYLNPPGDLANTTQARITELDFLNAGALVGYNWTWWLNADARVRGAWTKYRSATAEDEITPLPLPEKDGWDVSLQLRGTIDRRSFDRGVQWGSYLQAEIETSIPGFDDYGYQLFLLRAYHSIRFAGEHQLEARVHVNVGHELPFHNELTTGGTTDLRGYSFDQFRGDRRYVARAEYSFPIYRYRWLTFRGITFFDTAYAALRSTRDSRDYLPTARDGMSWWRNDAGGGIRIYVNNIVLPLLGFDIGYGLENQSTAMYFQLGLTDF